MGVLDGLADFQLGDDVNQHSDCFIDDEDDNQEWRMDPEFEYDAPQYFDFCRLLEQMKHLGHKAQYYETPEEAFLMERWFKKIHLDHEYDEEPQPPVNLLLLGEEGDENQIANNQDEMKAFSEMASKFMSDFSVNSVNPVSQQPARPQAKPSMKMNMKISQQCKHSPETLKRNEIAKLTRELRLQPKHSQFITRRKSRSQQEKDDLKLIRVQPSACKIDNALRNDVSKVLQAHNQSIQARRMADKRPVKSSVQPVKTLIQPVQQKPSKSDGKLKNEIMELLNSHNQTVKAKRTVIRH